MGRIKQNDATRSQRRKLEIEDSLEPMDRCEVESITSQDGRPKITRNIKTLDKSKTNYKYTKTKSSDNKMTSSKSNVNKTRKFKCNKSTNQDITLQMESSSVEESGTVRNNSSHICSIDGVSHMIKSDKQDTDNCYSCGACSQMFQSICQLHDHLVGSHDATSSYHYHILKQIAFPKYEMFCQFTQTDDLVELIERSGQDDEIIATGTDDCTPEPTGSDSSVASTDKCNKTLKADIIKTEYKNEVDPAYPVTVADPSLSSKECKMSLTKTGSCDEYVEDDDGENEDDCDIVEDSIHKAMNVDNVSDVETNNNTTLQLTRKRSKKKNKEEQKAKKKVKKEKDEPQDKDSKESDIGDKSVPKGKSKEKPGVFKCEICGIVCSFKKGLIRHERRQHVEELKFSCSYCNNKYFREDNLLMHIKVVHMSLLKPKRKRKQKNDCTVIQEGGNKSDMEMAETQKFETLLKIEKAASKKAEHHPCHICGRVILQRKMAVHQRLHSGERPFICTICGQGLISQIKLTRHMYIHTKAKEHKCDVCGIAFRMKYKLQMHKLIHTDDRPYLCSVCGAGFNNRSNLYSHNRFVHQKVKTNKCPSCDACFSTRSHLQDHMLKHSSEKQFTCRYCGKSFKYPKGLRRHEQNHAEVKGYKCGQCDKLFSTRESLESHHNDHDTTTQCRFCRKNFPDIKALRVHAATACKTKTFTCSICDETYNVANKYYTHMLAAHNIDREQAKKMNSGDKTSGGVVISCSPSSVDPNLPLQLEAPPSKHETIRKDSPSVLSNYHVSQVVSGMLDEEQLSITAMTRVATENLRLHSEDIDKSEPISSLQNVARSLTDSQILTAVRNVSCGIHEDKSSETSQTSSSSHGGPSFKRNLKFPSTTAPDDSRQLSHTSSQSHLQQYQQHSSHGLQSGVVRPLVMSQPFAINYSTQSVDSHLVNFISGPRPVQDLRLLTPAMLRTGDQSLTQLQLQQSLEARHALGTLALVACTESSNPEGQNSNNSFRIQNMYN